LTKAAKIIDIGGGDSKLADYLPSEGFEILRYLTFQPKLLKKQSNVWATKQKK